jgi:hypothetical protein
MTWEWYYVGFVSAAVAVLSFQTGLHFGRVSGYIELRDDVEEYLKKLK